MLPDIGWSLPGTFEMLWERRMGSAICCSQKPSSSHCKCQRRIGIGGPEHVAPTIPAGKEASFVLGETIIVSKMKKL